MPIATDYPFMGIFWSTLIFMAFFLWIWIAIMIFSDIFRRHDIGGGVKTLWVIFVFIVPYFGAFIYLISQGRGMAERAQRMQAAQVSQVRQEMSYSVADELEKLDRLHQQGALSDAEYQQARAKALA